MSLPQPIEPSRTSRVGRGFVWKLLLAGGLVLALIGAGFVTLVFWAFQGADQAEQAGVDGQAYGASAYDAACLAKASQDLEGGYSGHFGMAQAEFLRACLATASTTPSFCEGVPVPSDEVATTSWFIATCGEAEDIAGMSCRGLYNPILYHCLERRARN